MRGANRPKGTLFASPGPIGKHFTRSTYTSDLPKVRGAGREALRQDFSTLEAEISTLEAGPRDAVTLFFRSSDVWNGRPMRPINRICSGFTAQCSNSHTVAARRLTALRRLLAGRCTNGLRASRASSRRVRGQPMDKRDRDASSWRLPQLLAGPQPQGHTVGSSTHTL